MNAYNDSCKCLTRGEDDGQETCWKHHDCTQGYCTHIEDNEANVEIDCGEQ